MTTGSVLEDCVVESVFFMREIAAIAADQVMILERKWNGSLTDRSGRDGDRSLGYCAPITELDAVYDRKVTVESFGLSTVG